MSQVPISTIVNVQISLETQGVTQAGFGVPLVLTNESPLISWGSELVRSYSSLTEVLDDWTTSDEAYKAASAAFGQTPKITELKIGLETARVAQVSTITFDAVFVTGNTVGSFNISGGGTLDTITATPFNTDNATTLADITAKIQALSGYTAVDNGTDTITVTSADPGKAFSITTPIVTGGASQAVATVATTVDNVGPGESLAAISEQDDDWYGVIWIERSVPLVEQMANYIQGVRKIFGTVSGAAGVIDPISTTDIGYILSAANYTRTFVIYNADVSDYAEAAWMGRIFPYDPGSVTWKFKTLAGITADILTSSQRGSAEDKNVNIYVEVGGNDITTEGVMANGEYIDIIRGTDWLQARMEERIFSRLIKLPKLPFTAGGTGVVETDVRAVLDNAIFVGFLSGDALDPGSNDEERATRPYIVSIPDVAAISANDKAERHLQSVTFEARAAGAIHKVTIQGVITV